MSWEQELFAYLDDLEGQAGASYDGERVEELLDRNRAEYRSVTLGARLAASVDRTVSLDVLGVGLVSGRLERAATGWCLVRDAGQDWVVALAAVTSVLGASERALPEVAWSSVARLGLGSALRRIADSGEACVLHQVDGRRYDGVLRRVGADFVELATGEQERIVLIALAGLAAVQSRGRDGDQLT